MKFQLSKFCDDEVFAKILGRAFPALGALVHAPFTTTPGPGWGGEVVHCNDFVIVSWTQRPQARETRPPVPVKNFPRSSTVQPELTVDY